MLSKAAREETEFVLHEDETCDRKHWSKGSNIRNIICWKHRKSCGKWREVFKKQNY